MKIKHSSKIREQLKKWAHQPGRSLGDRTCLLGHLYSREVTPIEGKIQVEQDNNSVKKARIWPTNAWKAALGNIPCLVLDTGPSNEWWKSLTLKEKLDLDGKEVRAFYMSTRHDLAGSDAAVVFVEPLKTAKPHSFPPAIIIQEEKPDELHDRTPN